MNIASLVEKTIGSCFFIIAISLIIRPILWLKMTTKLVQKDSGIKSYFFFSLILGLLVIFTHNIWDFNSGLLVTVFGWALLVESLIGLIYPELFKKVLPTGENKLLLFRVLGIILALLCSWILIPYFGPAVRFF